MTFREINVCQPFPLTMMTIIFILSIFSSYLIGLYSCDDCGTTQNDSQNIECECDCDYPKENLCFMNLTTGIEKCEYVPIGSECFSDEMCDLDGYCNKNNQNKYVCSLEEDLCYVAIFYLDGNGNTNVEPILVDGNHPCVFAEFAQLHTGIFTYECLVKFKDGYREASRDECKSSLQ